MATKIKKPTKTTGPMALITSVEWDKYGAPKSIQFIAGDFSNATFYTKKMTPKSVYRHFTDNPTTPCRMPSKVAQTLFGLKPRELWHDEAK